MRGPIGDRVVLLMTFILTVAFDLTVAIEAGIVLAAFLFMHRMSEVVAIQSHVDLPVQGGDESGDDPDQRAKLPPHTDAYRFYGPMRIAFTARCSSRSPIDWMLCSINNVKRRGCSFCGWGRCH